MEKEKVYTLATVYVEFEEARVCLISVSTQIYKDKEVAILDAKANADADFYIAGDRDKCAFFEYDEKDVLGICHRLNERQQIYGNKIERYNKLSHTWRLVFEKEIK